MSITSNRVAARDRNMREFWPGFTQSFLLIFLSEVGDRVSNSLRCINNGLDFHTGNIVFFENPIEQTGHIFAWFTCHEFNAHSICHDWCYFPLFTLSYNDRTDLCYNVLGIRSLHDIRFIV